jgi:hypothetical protein
MALAVNPNYNPPPGILKIINILQRVVGNTGECAVAASMFFREIGKFKCSLNYLLLFAMPDSKADLKLFVERAAKLFVADMNNLDELKKATDHLLFPDLRNLVMRAYNSQCYERFEAEMAAKQAARDAKKAAELWKFNNAVKPSDDYCWVATHKRASKSGKTYTIRGHWRLKPGRTATVFAKAA